MNGDPMQRPATLSVAALLDRPGIDSRRVESTPASSPANRYPSRLVQADDEIGIVNLSAAIETHLGFGNPWNLMHSLLPIAPSPRA
jgi:hypothetical protein